MPVVPDPGGPPVVSSSSQVTGLVFVLNIVSGLEPGRMLEQTFEFTPDDSDFPRFYGGTAAEVDKEGKLYAFDQIGWICRGQSGVIHGWWREPGTPVWADPIELEDGRAEIRIKVPG